MHTIYTRWVRNVRAILVCGFLIKSLKKHILKFWKKSWVPFGRYLINSTADSAQFEWKWAGLAVLFSRQLPNGSHNFFSISQDIFFNNFIKNPQTTITLTFLTHIISSIGGVKNHASLTWQILATIQFFSWISFDECQQDIIVVWLVHQIFYEYWVPNRYTNLFHQYFSQF